MAVVPVDRTVVLNGIPQPLRGFNPLIVAAAPSRSVPSRASLKTTKMRSYKIKFSARPVEEEGIEDFRNVKIQAPKYK
jgi:hypothetical protein